MTFIYYEIRTTRYTNKNTMLKKYTKIHKKYIMKYTKTQVDVHKTNVSTVKSRTAMINMVNL